jgi:hypothetical protein
MVEYAVLVAGASLRSLAADISNFAPGVNWTLVGYGILIVLALRIASWAFRPTR